MLKKFYQTLNNINMSKLTDFIEKRLQDKKTQRWVIPSKDLFDLFISMGIMEDEELLMDILEYLEENKIDIYFKDDLEQIQYSKFKKLERGYQLRKRHKEDSGKNKESIKKIMEIKPKVDENLLLEYMTDDEEVIEELKKLRPTFNKDLQDLQENFTKQIHIKMLEKAPPIDKEYIENIRNNP